MFTAFWITVGVRSPRKSILKAPSSSMVVAVNWVVMVPVRRPGWGTNSSMERLPITHARRVHGGVWEVHSDACGHVDQVVDRLIFIIRFFQIGIHDQVLYQRHAKIIESFSRWSLKLHRQSSTRPTSRTALGRQGTGDDLHHLIFSYFSTIVDDFLPPLAAEVHVDVGHGHALRVYKGNARTADLVADRIDVE